MLHVKNADDKHHWHCFCPKAHVHMGDCVLNNPLRLRRAGTNHCYILSHHERTAAEQTAQDEQSKALKRIL